jgi:hypothetical protein
MPRSTALRIFTAGFVVPWLASSPASLKNAHGDRRILDLEIVTIEPTALRIDAFSG